jgi:uncharacterized membrane-anchored protein YitT (DUF2179 family)
MRDLISKIATLDREASLLTLAYIGGLGLLAFGVAMIFVPAGLIVGGGASVASAVLYARGRQWRS